MIDKNKKYRTRDGREVRVFMTDSGDWNFPVIAAYRDSEGRWWPLRLTKDGRVSFHLSNHDDLDLVEAKPRIKREVWVNVYPEGFGMVCESKEKADIASGAECKRRIACVKLTIDCEEGEGL